MGKKVTPEDVMEKVVTAEAPVEAIEEDIKTIETKLVKFNETCCGIYGVYRAGERYCLTPDLYELLKDYVTIC